MKHAIPSSAPASGNVFVPRTQWLARAEVEPILDPDLAIVDAHHHVWDRPGFRYLLDDLMADLDSGHRVVGTVFVDASAMYRTEGPPEFAPVGEVEFANEVATISAGHHDGRPRVAAGIISHADLTLGSRVDAVLEAQQHAAPERFRGIRFASGWHASPEIRNGHTNPPAHLLARDDFRAGFACLAPRGLVFEAWLYHHQLCELTALARAFPDTTIVLNHVGGPLGYGPYQDRRDEVFTCWALGLAELANCANVMVKVGGLGMNSAGFNFDAATRPPTSAELAEAWRPYVETAIDLFGVHRCMFESNFPVDKVSAPYASIWNAFKRLTANYSNDERRALFSTTTTAVYRLGVLN